MLRWLSRLSFRFRPRARRYFDLTLEISPPSGKGKKYLVSATSSLAEVGQGQGDFLNPFEGENGWQHLSTRHIGEKLFSALFQDRDLRSLFDLSVGTARGAGRGLRLRLTFDMVAPRRDRMVPVADLPWELLYKDGHFLAMDEQFSLVRQLPSVSSAAAGGPAAFSGSVLLAWANPQDRPSLDLRTECRRIARVCGTSRLKPEILSHATVARVTQQLQAKEYTVFHFMGHGEIGEDGALVFEDAEGKSDPVSGEGLASLVQGTRGLRLAVLNACHSSDAPRADPWAGVAPALIRRGLPAVLGIRSEIQDLAAILFSERFYSSLADGAPLEKATIEGRLAVLADSRVREDWQVPVLYQQPALGPPAMIDFETNGHLPRSKRLLGAAALLAAAVLVGAALLFRQAESSVAISCPESGLVRSFEEVRGVGRDPAGSYYLFIRDPMGTCWLQGPVPLQLDHDGRWSAKASFGGWSGDRFTILAVSSRRPLHPEPLGRPDQYPCSVVPADTDRATCSVVLASTTAD